MKKVFNSMKNNYKYIIFFFIFFVSNLLFFKKMYCDLNHNNIYLILIVISCLIEIVGVYLINRFVKDSLKIEKKFLIIGMFLGILYMLALPIGTVPDEANHFRRAYEISEGYLISDKNKDGVGGRKLPVSINKTFSFNVHNVSYQQVLSLIEKTKNYSKKEFQTFGNTSLYAAICYVPQSIGILIGRILHLPMVLLVYLARLLNLSCFLALMYFSVKYIPINKKILMLIIFLPISMQAASSCQPDALTNAVAFSLITFTLYKINNKKMLTKKEKIIMSLLAIVMSLCKIVYIPICLILYLIPEKCFMSKKDKYLKITILGVIVVILNLIWLAISSSFLVEFQEGVNSALQVKGILTNPIKYIYVLFETINKNGTYYFYTSLGSYLGYFDMLLSEMYLLIYLFFTIYTGIIDKNKDLIKETSKLLIIFIILICIILIFTSIYVQWTAYNSDIISGVQGRYFIPLFLLVPLLFSTSKIKSTFNDNIKYVFTIILMLNIYSIMTVIFYHI